MATVNVTFIKIFAGDERQELPKSKAPQPCVLQESEKRVGSQKCKRIRPPSPDISSPVSSISETTPSVASTKSDLNVEQVQDCKIHRLLRNTEQLRRGESDLAKGRVGERTAWESSRYPLLADQTNKCIWKERTCSEEFVDRMVSDKLKRDRKYLKCNH